MNAQKYREKEIENNLFARKTRYNAFFSKIEL